MSLDDLDIPERRVRIGMALVHFFAALRGRGLSAEEHAEAAYAGDNWLYRDDCERAHQREMREVFGG